MREVEKLFICKDKNGEIYATNGLAQGYVLATLDELENNQWLYEKFSNAIFIVNHNS